MLGGRDWVIVALTALLLLNACGLVCAAIDVIASDLDGAQALSK